MERNTAAVISQAAHTGLGAAAVRVRRWRGNVSASLSCGPGHDESVRSSEVFAAQVGAWAEAGLAVQGDACADGSVFPGST